MAKSKTSRKNPKSGKIQNRFISWLKPTTPAKAMILFVLVFSIVGGGYLLSKSFAADWDADHSSILGVYKANKTRHCWGKRCRTVWRLLPGGYAVTRFPPIPGNYTLKSACMYGGFGADAGGPVYITIDVAAGGVGYPSKQFLPSGPQMKIACAKPASWQIGGSREYIVYVENVITNTRNLFLDTISLQLVRE